MKRLTSVDISRGIAIICMIAADIPILTDVGITKFFAAMLAAPFFIFIAGVSYELFFISRKEKYSELLTLEIETFWKAIILLGITQFIFIMGVILFPSKFSFGFNSSVFFVIAVGYLLSIIIPGRWIYQLPFIILPFLILYFSNSLERGMLSFLFSPAFPLIPFIAYFFAGRWIMIFYRDVNDPEMKNWMVVFFSAFIVAGTGIIFHFFDIPFNFSSRTTILGFLLLVGVIISILSLFSIIESRTNKYDFFLLPVERIGRIAFSTYYVFYAMEIVGFPYLNRVIIVNFDPRVQVITFYLSIVIIVIVMSLIEKTWKKVDYLGGMEWIMRRGSGLLTKITIKHMRKTRFRKNSD